MPKAALKTCFILAPVKADTAPLRSALEGRGIRWSDAVSAEPGTSILQTIESAIANSDFVCVVLTSADPARNVVFEMGLAMGLKRPLLVFAEEGAAIPMQVQDITYAKTSITDKNALDFYLDAFLRHADKKKASKRRASTSKIQSRIDVNWALSQLEELRAKPPNQRARDLEELVARLFEAGGAVVSREGKSDVGVDMAVWIDELESSIGNPLIVEIKAGLITEQRLRDAENRLQSFFPRVHARAALIVYDDVQNKKLIPRQITWPLIFRLSIEELIELVGRQRLAQAILRERNKLVHGVVAS